MDIGYTLQFRISLLNADPWERFSDRRPGMIIGFIDKEAS